ncbi:Gfo/Idh/MocA family oxidoreductase [Nonomuraea glycinis]|uniref:Oxidoreductase n=1 Tax=Nonomuraea glycinis TaxID=2047744 RepID=A0A917ZXI0_9ACTN|nr:Gfo/Idh/MocA family oxidoreductase [Nonomuraea glycinis]MCA2175281.1 Gfo/Idh/MocA family oxidoreductase [Nonomuraea glycinis]WSG68738.1 Gfo/Idh/MocA family oxidoreductase [Nonomuraea glycinis]GGP00351.1 oxidoreductase [Nonomuraea glycinis]
MSDRTVGVGMIGYAFMGRVHSQAWRSVAAFFDVPVIPRMRVISGRSREATKAAAEQMGWEEAVTDWREVIGRPDVDIVDICTPGDTHAEIAIAALRAGKHVICEKPLANTVAEAEAMVQAAASATGRSMVAFNYRRVPAVALARDLVAQGRLGEIRHVRAQYLQDWIVDPEFPLVWRLQKDKAGSGALGDIGAHIIDAAEFISGQLITGVSALTETFIKERPLSEGSSGLAAAGGSGRGTVTVDDAALFTARLSGGAVGSFEATRFATGRKNAMRIELNGSLGSLAFDFESMNELWFSEGGKGFERILVTEPDHPYVGAWWPPGHGLGYEHTFTHEIRDFLEAIGQGTDPTPSFADGLRVQRVLAAVEQSAADGSRFTTVEDT